ncbi:MAG: hypothetical protein EZS28_048406, partial [Streblomastix strix]
CVSGYSGRQLSIGLKYVQIQLFDRKVDCKVRIGALCMCLLFLQLTELTRVFGMVLTCVHSWFICFLDGRPIGMYNSSEHPVPTAEYRSLVIKSWSN